MFNYLSIMVATGIVTNQNNNNEIISDPNDRSRAYRWDGTVSKSDPQKNY